MSGGLPEGVEERLCEDIEIECTSLEKLLGQDDH